MCVPVSMLRLQVGIRCFPHFSTLSFLREDSHVECRSKHFLDLSVCLPGLVLGLISGPHVCEGSTLPTETSPQP